MMAGIEVRTAVASSAGGRQRSKIRRRFVRLSPVVIGICFLMIFASWTTLLAYPAKATGNSNLLAPVTPSFSGPSGPAPTSNCFGGANPCTGTGTSTTAGKGTTCVISSFAETAGDFMYVGISYLANTNIITSVADGGVDSFSYVGGEFSTSQSVAFYDVSSEYGGTVTITVTISTAEFGTCRVGQLTAGTTVGVVGMGGNANSDSYTSLSVTNSPVYEPSLLLALFGSTRPSGPWESPLPSGSWITGGFQETGYNPGTNSEVIGYNDTALGMVTFTQTLENSGYDIYLSGIVVEFYLPPAASTCFGGSPCTGPQGTTHGSGTLCEETINAIPGDLVYIAATWAGPNVLSGVGSDIALPTYVGSEYSASESVVFYDITDLTYSGASPVWVSLTTPEFGSCSIGQLPAGIQLGAVGTGGTANADSDTSLSVTVTPAYQPTLLLALFGSTRPSGPWEPGPSGSWLEAGFFETGYNPGTNSELIGYNNLGTGTATFTETLENSGYDIYLSGIAVAFYSISTQTPPYILPEIASSPTGSGNSYPYGPVVTVSNGGFYDYQETSASNSQGTLWTYLEIQGQPVTFATQATAEFTFQLAGAYDWGWSTNCAAAGAMFVAVGAAWVGGLLGTQDYLEDQLFAEDESGPCTYEPHAGTSTFSGAAAASPADTTGSAAGTIVFTATLSPGSYTPYVELGVYTAATAGGISSASAWVNIGNNGFGGWWSYVIVED